MRNDNYLQHYGVKGMKWGVRRYVDDNNRPTKAGEKHLAKVSNSPRLQKKETKRAIKSLEKGRKFMQDNSDYSYKQSMKYLDKAHKASSKQKHEKVNEYNKKVINYAWTSGRYKAFANALDRTISSIKSGELTAGRDFVVARAPGMDGIYGNYEFAEIKK